MKTITIKVRNVDTEIYNQFKKLAIKERKTVGHNLKIAMQDYISKIDTTKKTREMIIKKKYAAQYNRTYALEGRAQIVLNWFNNMYGTEIFDSIPIDDFFLNAVTLITSEEFKNLKKHLPGGEERCFIPIPKKQFKKIFEEKYEKNPEIIVYFREKYNPDKSKIAGESGDILIGRPEDFGARTIERVLRQYNLFIELTDRNSETYKKLINVWRTRRAKIEKRLNYLNAFVDSIAKSEFLED